MFAVDGSSTTVPNPLAFAAAAAAKTASEEEARAKAGLQAAELAVKKAEEVSRSGIFIPGILRNVNMHSYVNIFHQ